MILIIDNYDSYTYNLYQQILKVGSVFGISAEVHRNDCVPAKSLADPALSGIVISPGPGGPHDTGQSRYVLESNLGVVPILGVCLGHQLIADYFDARIIRSPVPVHGKTAAILHDGSGLFREVASPAHATRYHSLLVEPSSVRTPLHTTAMTEDGLVMAVTHESLPVWGVQFHPESFLTEFGDQLMYNFLVHCSNGKA